MKVPVFDPNDPAQLDDLLGTWRRLRDHAPVQHTPIAGGTWLLTRFDDIKRLLRDAEALMKPPGLDPGAPLTGGPAERIYRGLMVPGPGHATAIAAAEVVFAQRKEGVTRCIGIHEERLTPRCPKTAPPLRVAARIPPCGVAPSSFA